MAIIQKHRIFTDPDFDIAIWIGNKNDYYDWWVSDASKRSNFASSSIVCSGSFGYPQFKDWPVVKAGEMVNSVIPDWPFGGTYRWTALEDNSVEICVSAIYNKEVPFYNVAIKDDILEFKANDILVLATGTATIKGKEFKSPQIVRMKEDTEVELHGEAMHLRR